jgi:hypothetical protein
VITVPDWSASELFDLFRTIATISTAICAILGYRLAKHRWGHDLQNATDRRFNEGVEFILKAFGKVLRDPEYIGRHLGENARSIEQLEEWIKHYAGALGMRTFPQEQAIPLVEFADTIARAAYYERIEAKQN